jgi:hypothetical protein
MMTAPPKSAAQNHLGIYMENMISGEDLSAFDDTGQTTSAHGLGNRCFALTANNEIEVRV